MNNITYRISDLSAVNEIFNKHISAYKQALMKAEYKLHNNIKYTPKKSGVRGYIIQEENINNQSQNYNRNMKNFNKHKNVIPTINKLDTSIIKRNTKWCIIPYGI